MEPTLDYKPITRVGRYVPCSTLCLRSMLLGDMKYVIVLQSGCYIIGVYYIRRYNNPPTSG